jgi:hypothetical protein
LVHPAPGLSWTGSHGRPAVGGLYKCPEGHRTAPRRLWAQRRAGRPRWVEWAAESLLDQLRELGLSGFSRISDAGLSGCPLDRLDLSRRVKAPLATNVPWPVSKPSRRKNPKRLPPPKRAGADADRICQGADRKEHLSVPRDVAVAHADEAMGASASIVVSLGAGPFQPPVPPSSCPLEDQIALVGQGPGCSTPSPLRSRTSCGPSMGGTNA